MTKNDHCETQNVIFERFWPISKFHFPACSTLVTTQKPLGNPGYITVKNELKSTQK